MKITVITGSPRKHGNSFVILVCTEGACRVACGEEETRLEAGHTLLVAAEADGVRLTPEGSATVLESYV